MSATLGQKIRFFRTKLGISQLELESEINTSSGTISRIESGITNPTKETIIQIAKKLNLTEIEKDYVVGFTSEPAELKELEVAKAEVKEIMSKPGNLAYLIDDRTRLIDVSDTFMDFLNLPKSIKSQFQNLSLVSLIMQPRYGIFKHLHPEDLENVIYNFLKSFYATSYFFLNDTITEESIKSIEQNDLALKLWKRVKAEPILSLQDMEARKVAFHFFGEKIELIFSNTPLVKYRRFYLVEYIPTKEFKDLFESKFKKSI